MMLLLEGSSPLLCSSTADSLRPCTSRSKVQPALMEYCRPKLSLLPPSNLLPSEEAERGGANSLRDPMRERPRLALWESMEGVARAMVSR